jgi:hypothetical protein
LRAAAIAVAATARDEAASCAQGARSTLRLRLEIAPDLS